MTAGPGIPSAGQGFAIRHRATLASFKESLVLQALSNRWRATFLKAIVASKNFR
jgi:hypothetical protein